MRTSVLNPPDQIQTVGRFSHDLKFRAAEKSFQARQDDGLFIGKKNSNHRIYLLCRSNDAQIPFGRIPIAKIQGQGRLESRFGNFPNGLRVGVLVDMLSENSV